MMHRRNRWFASALVAAGLGLAGCAQAQGLTSSDSGGPSRVVPVKGSQVHRVILSPRAVERIGVQTAPIHQSPASRSTGRAAPVVTVPVSALVYDEQGRTWVFTMTQAGSYVRQQVAVVRIDGDTVVLRNAPPAGTLVVTVGAPELLGTELGVGGE